MSSPNTRKAAACPLCARGASPAHAPFCSQGCRDRDLLRWLGDCYALPGRPTVDDDLEGLDTEPGRPL